MKLLLDQNLSPKLVRSLAEHFPDSAHVRDLDLAEATDRAVWDHAAANGFMIVSKDDDFRQLAFLHGAPPKVIWLRVGNGPTEVIRSLLAGSVATIERFARSDEESLLVLPGLAL